MPKVFFAFAISAIHYLRDNSRLRLLILLITIHKSVEMEAIFVDHGRLHVNSVGCNI